MIYNNIIGLPGEPKSTYSLTFARCSLSLERTAARPSALKEKAVGLNAPAFIALFSAFEAEKRGGGKGDNATLINRAIASKRKGPGSIPSPATLISVFHGFPKSLQARLGWIPNKGHGRFLPIPSPIHLPCATCTVSNDLAADETQSRLLFELQQIPALSVPVVCEYCLNKNRWPHSRLPRPRFLCRNCNRGNYRRSKFFRVAEAWKKYAMDCSKNYPSIRLERVKGFGRPLTARSREPMRVIELTIVGGEQANRSAAVTPFAWSDFEILWETEILMPGPGIEPGSLRGCPQFVASDKADGKYHRLREICQCFETELYAVHDVSKPCPRNKLRVPLFVRECAVVSIAIVFTSMFCSSIFSRVDRKNAKTVYQQPINVSRIIRITVIAASFALPKVPAWNMEQEEDGVKIAEPSVFTGTRRINIRRLGATVDERLDCSPPTKANRVLSPAGSLPDFPKWEPCWTMPLVGGFSRGSPISFIQALLRTHITSTSPALKTSAQSCREDTAYLEICVNRRVNGTISRRRLSVESEGDERHVKLHLDGFILAWANVTLGAASFVIGAADQEAWRWVCSAVVNRPLESASGNMNKKCVIVPIAKATLALLSPCKLHECYCRTIAIALSRYQLELELIVTFETEHASIV
ncbi:hypothetical protein PR048_032629 [Dryococelus australis]|uniref:Uncharacterized protein n=1 Tax=Dryococelus australis TaxID=614101 RepID=A0ABQ9G2R6_9NEOP|nr:hypothetical protein PR048_032629 [Dryococelus australis]